MKRLTRLLAAVGAMVIAAVGVARADMYINGKGGLTHGDWNKCTYYGTGFRCSLSTGRATTVTFHDQTHTKLCVVRVFNNGNVWGDKWHIEILPDMSGWKCTYYWTNNNTVDISPPLNIKHLFPKFP